MKPQRILSPALVALSLLLIGWLSAPTAHAAPTDLTSSGVIAGIDRTNTYNLGATGLRGWIWVDRNNMGDSGLITDQSRQILITHCVAPANAVLAVDDVILGAMAASSGTVPDFTSDCRKAFGTAIADAEKTGAGTLRVKRWRAGVVTDQNIPLPILGNYSATAPFSCPKSDLILDGVRNKMVADLLANSNYLYGQFEGSSNALALLSGVKPGDPNYSEVQTRLQIFARSLASAGPVNDGLPIWSWSYSLIFLSEYYLLANDAQVVPGIQSFTLMLAQTQSIYGTYGHGPAKLRPDGSGKLYSTGYGPVNAVGGTAAIALVLGKKALVAAGQSVDAQIDAAIQRASGFFAFYVNKGGIPYGEHEPSVTGHGSNGKDAMPAVFFGLQTGRAAETEYFSRISIAGWIGREYGHTGQGLSYYWATLGALMGGPDAASEHLKQIRWHLDLSRRTDGSFAYDGQEQYGPGTTSGNTYLGAAEYGGMTANAMYLLTYSLPLQRLWITGKSANPAYTLNSTKIAAAVSAGSFRLDRSAKSIFELFTAIGDYDPIVRNFASVELASRTLTSTDLTNLRSLLSSADSNLRQSACQTLGIRQDITALPTIVARLNDPDIWVRAKAAIAIRAYPSATASTHRDSMMTSFIANATDPAVIDWNDPLQMGNGKLSMAVFGHGVGDGTPGNDIAAYTINAPKQTLLYPAVRAGLKQPDSYVRAGAIQFSKNRLPLADIQAVYPEAANVAEFDTPADRMWSGSCRADAITMLAALKITDAIPLTLAMLESAPGFEWGEREPRIGALNALASYGDAARYTLPTLRAYLNEWSPTSEEYPILVTTINAIENAITAPAQEPGLCVANSQVVTTTGAKAITLSGVSPRGAFSYLNVTQPANGTVTGTAPNLTYTPNVGYTGPDKFTFQTTDTLTTSTVATVGIVVGSSGNGVKGDYFNNMDFTSPVLNRTDSQINFDWGTGSPHASIGPDTFSARWSGVLLVPQTGSYTFSSLTSDGVRLYVNGQLVIDRFVDQSTRWTDGTPIQLTAGQYADIYLEYYENTGSAVAKLKWTGPSFAGANGSIIPQTHLFDGSGMSNRPAYAFSQNLTSNQNTPLPIALSGSGGTLTYAMLTQPVNGTLSGTAPYLTYTPNSNFSGTDSFTFLVNNGTNNSLPATISINVQSGALSSFTWASAVSGNWSDGTKWTPGLPVATGLPYYALNFTTSGTYTATHNLNTAFQLNQLNVAPSVTIDGTQSVSFVANGGTLPQLNQSVSGTATINHPIVLQATTTVGGSGNIIVNGAISGNGGLIKNGPGTLEIAQNNSYSGGTTINAGTLRMADQKDSALGSSPVTLNGGTLHALRINTAIPVTANGGRLWGDGGWGGSWNGSFTLNGDLTVFTYPYDRVSINGNISGAGGLIAEGNSSTYNNSSNGIFLAGTNTYTGKTAITSGMLLHCASPAALGSGAVEISGGARLDLNFTGTKAVASLTLDGVSMPSGTYGSTTSNATNKNDTYFSGNGTLTLLPPSNTSLALTSGSTPANPGTSLTFIATVTGSTPTGNVQFYSGSTLLGTAALNGSFQAALTTTQLAIGSNSITARYVGNSSNSPSTSSPVVVEINNTAVAAPTGLSATPVTLSINLNWTASTAASGYYVKRSTTNGGPYTVIALVSGTTYQDNAILNGVPYYYVVSAINAAGESASSNQATAYTGSLTATNTALTSSPVATGVYGTSVTFSATVTSSSGTPTGTVTFRSGSNVIGTATLSSGTASLAISTLAAATHSITASYAGSLDPSTSSALSYQVTPKPLTISGVSAANKVYDGTTTATLSGGTLSGVIGGDTVTIVPGIGTFADANVGTWAVTATSYSLGGTHAANYTLSAQPTVPNATITARPIDITGTKTYDGTTAAPSSILTIANNVDGGNLSLVGSGTLSDKNAGTRTLSSIFATPVRIQSAKGNTGTGTSATIGVTLTSTPVNGNTLVAVISTRGTSASRVSGISGGGVTWSRVSQAANSNGTTTEIWYGPNVSTGTTGITISQATLRSAAVVMEYSGLLTPTSFDLAANNNGNTTAPNTGTTTTTTQAAELWIGGIGIVSSTPTLSAVTNSFATVDNSVTTSTTTGNNARIYALERMVTSTGTAFSGGTITTAQWSGAIATFKAAPSLTLTGSAAANYTLTGLTSAVTINPKPLMVSGLSASNKAYDGTTAAGVTGTPALLSTQAPGAGTTSDGKPYTGDTISLSGSPTGGSFTTKHVGNAKPVTGVTGLTLSGAQAGNYTLVPLSTLTAIITQRSITVAAVTETKTYDGTTTASNTPTLTPALASGDTTSVLSQSYQTRDAGTSNKTLVPTITIDDGNGGNNYLVTLTNFTTGTITPKSITVAAVNATKTYDETTTASGTPTITPALVSGDTTSVLSQSFQTATAGINNKVIIPAITITDGNSGNNYAVVLANFTTGTINKAAATVTLGNLSQTYDGTAKTVTATTNPTLLAYSVTYDGSTSAPVNGGTYAVVATVNDTNYAGSGSGSLVIAKAAQTITFASISPVLDNAAPFPLGATASSGLTVSYSSSNTNVATVSGNTVTVVGIGSTTITASQAGDTNYNAAASVPQTLTVVRANPLAVTGGPYKVLYNQSLPLNGGGSQPSYGATITSYSWDLNNDDIFGDATGANASISFADLTSPTTWNMKEGLNPIKLQVTDSAGKTSATVSTTVEIVIGLTWDANTSSGGIQDGSGVWIGGNWRDGSTNQSWTSGSSANFGNGGTGAAVTLASPTTVNALTFNSFTGTYTLGTANQALTINGGITMNASAGTATISSPITLGGAQTWTNHSANLLTVSGAVGNGGHLLAFDGTGTISLTTALAAGGGGITKNGVGRLQLSNAAQLYTGPTIVNGGVLSYGDDSSYLSAANITLNGGVIDQRWTTIFTRALGTGSNQIQIIGGASGFSNNNGSHTVRINNNAATEMVWGAANEAGNVLATGFFNPSTFVLQSAFSQGANTLTFANNIDLNGTTRTIQANSGVAGTSISTLSGVIRTSRGTAGIIKTGGGILIFSGANTYNGSTTISEGMVDFGAIALSGFGGGSGRNISVAAGASVRRNTLDNAFLNRLVETSSEIAVMTGTTANNLNFGASAGANLPNAFLGNWASNGAKAEYSGVFTPAADAYRLGSPTSSGLLGITSAMTGTQGLIVGGNRVELVNAGNTFSGDTFIRNGARLYLGNNLALQNSALDTGVVSNTGTFGLSDGALSGRTAGSIASPSPVFGGLKGSRNLLSAYNGTAAANNAQLLAATAVTGFTLNPGSGQAHSYSGAIADFAAGTTLTKTGLGTQILAGANTYTGATNINTGKLFINGSLSNVAVALNVSSGATLGGTGTIGRNVTVAAGGKLEFSLSTAAASHDRLDISTGRSFGFSGTSDLTITSSGGAVPGIYTLFTGGNAITGAAPATLNLPVGWAATVSISGNSLLLNVTSTNAPGPVDHFAISTISPTRTVGTPITGITITAQDVANQTATSFTGTVTFGGTAGITGTSAAFTAGVLTGVSITPTVVGSNLTFTVNDGAGHTGSATFTVLSLYDAWATANGATGGSGSDPDGDQLTNLQEYAFGTDPTVSSGGFITYNPGGNVTTPGQPVATNLASPGVDYRAIFGRRKDYLTAGLTYTVEFSADLTNWVPSTVTPTVLTNTTGGIDAVSVPYPFFIPVQGGFKKPTYFKVGVMSN